MVRIGKKIVMDDSLINKILSCIVCRLGSTNIPKTTLLVAFTKIAAYILQTTKSTRRQCSI